MRSFLHDAFICLRGAVSCLNRGPDDANSEDLWTVHSPGSHSRQPSAHRQVQQAAGLARNSAVAQSEWGRLAQGGHARPVVLLLLDLTGHHVLWSNRDLCDAGLMRPDGSCALISLSPRTTEPSGHDESYSVVRHDGEQPSFLSELLGEPHEATEVLHHVLANRTWCGSVRSNLADALVDLQRNPDIALPGDYVTPAPPTDATQPAAASAAAPANMGLPPPRKTFTFAQPHADEWRRTPSSNKSEEEDSVDEGSAGGQPQPSDSRAPVDSSQDKDSPASNQDKPPARHSEPGTTPQPPPATAPLALPSIPHTALRSRGSADPMLKVQPSHSSWTVGDQPQWVAPKRVLSTTITSTKTSSLKAVTFADHAPQEKEITSDQPRPRRKAISFVSLRRGTSNVGMETAPHSKTQAGVPSSCVPAEEGGASSEHAAAKTGPWQRSKSLGGSHLRPLLDPAEPTSPAAARQRNSPKRSVSCLAIGNRNSGGSPRPLATRPTGPANMRRGSILAPGGRDFQRMSSNGSPGQSETLPLYNTSHHNTHSEMYMSDVEGGDGWSPGNQHDMGSSVQVMAPRVGLGPKTATMLQAMLGGGSDSMPHVRQSLSGSLRTGSFMPGASTPGLMPAGDSGHLPRGARRRARTSGGGVEPQRVCSRTGSDTSQRSASCYVTSQYPMSPRNTAPPLSEPFSRVSDTTPVMLVQSLSGQLQGSATQLRQQVTPPRSLFSNSGSLGPQSVSMCDDAGVQPDAHARIGGSESGEDETVTDNGELGMPLYVAEVTLRLMLHRSAEHGARPLLLVSCHDISQRAAMDTLLSKLVESQLGMVSQMFPYHVIEYLCKQPDHMAPDAPNASGTPASPSSAVQPAVRHGIAQRHVDVTVMFMDIVGFTTMSKEVEPYQVMDYLNELFSHFDELINVHGVHKVETAGDCYIVSAGVLEEGEGGFLHVVQEHDPAVSAARVMAYAKDMLHFSATVLMPHNGQRTQVRIGMHTGTCMSGLVGSRLPKFSIYGDSINTSSRMESTSIPGRIQVSDTTQMLLPGEAWEATGGVHVKGKGTMMTYLWVDPAATSGPSAPGSSSIQDGQAHAPSGKQRRKSLVHYGPALALSMLSARPSMGNIPRENQKLSTHAAPATSVSVQAHESSSHAVNWDMLLTSRSSRDSMNKGFNLRDTIATRSMSRAGSRRASIQDVFLASSPFIGDFGNEANADEKSNGRDMQRRLGTGESAAQSSTAAHVAAAYERASRQPFMLLGAGLDAAPAAAGPASCRPTASKGHAPQQPHQAPVWSNLQALVKLGGLALPQAGVSSSSPPTNHTGTANHRNVSFSPPMPATAKDRSARGGARSSLDVPLDGVDLTSSLLALGPIGDSPPTPLDVSIKRGQAYLRKGLHSQHDAGTPPFSTSVVLGSSRAAPGQPQGPRGFFRSTSYKETAPEFLDVSLRKKSMDHIPGPLQRNWLLQQAQETGDFAGLAQQAGFVGVPSCFVGGGNGHDTSAAAGHDDVVARAIITHR